MKANSEKFDKLVKELNEVMGRQRGRVFNDLFVLNLRDASEDKRNAAFNLVESLIDPDIDKYQESHGLSGDT